MCTLHKGILSTKPGIHHLNITSTGGIYYSCYQLLKPLEFSELKNRPKHRHLKPAGQGQQAI